MRGQPGFFDIDDRLKRLSDLGDQLETFRSAVDFELFRSELNAALSYTDRTEGGRPPFDPALMFKNLVIQATNNLSDLNAPNFSSMTGCRLDRCCMTGLCYARRPIRHITQLRSG